tara:strand:+ start:413 stop:619 length:207 start_codon:yes stop_codon:yes gene_type:complete
LNIDTKSAAWLEIASWADEEIKTRHELLEMTRLSHEDTQFIRGEVSSLKALLAMPTVSPLHIASGNYE